MGWASGYGVQGYAVYLLDLPTAITPLTPNTDLLNINGPLKLDVSVSHLTARSSMTGNSAIKKTDGTFINAVTDLTTFYDNVVSPFGNSSKNLALNATVRRVTNPGSNIANNAIRLQFKVSMEDIKTTVTTTVTIPWSAFTWLPTGEPLVYQP